MTGRCNTCGSAMDVGTDGVPRCPRCLLEMGLLATGETAGATPTRSGSAPPIEPAVGIPARIGAYRVVRRLGAGGMGVVFEAEQQSPRRRVALKVIRGGPYVDEQHLRLFRREALSLARLKHPSIAQIYELGRTADGQEFFAMELVRGATLGAWLQAGGAHAIRTRLEVFRKICDAVAYAHLHGVIHRDLKPSNVLVLDDPHEGRSSTRGLDAPDVKVLDFGLARITDSDMSMTSVASERGVLRGTLPYMSPEQTQGNPERIDLRTDVYSLGVILYEMLCDRLPYDVRGKSLAEAVRTICDEPPSRRISGTTGSGTPSADALTIALKALEKDPARRYATVHALSEDVERCLTSQPILARPPSAAYQLRKLIERHRIAFGVLILFIAMLAGFGATMALQARRIAAERDRANSERQAAQEVSDFLAGLFQVVDPGAARGRTITAREILDRGAQRIEHELGRAPATQGRLMHVMGDVYRGLGLTEDALRLLRSALEIREREFGVESSEVAATLDTLVHVIASGRQPGDARPLGERALRIRRASARPDEAAIGRTSYFLALAEFKAGAVDSARTRFHDALEMLERTFGPDSIEVAWCLNDLGNTYLFGDGDPALARPYIERALAIKEARLPHDHFDLAVGRGSLGYARMRLGEYDEAAPLLRRALADVERLLGERHEVTGNALSSLGELEWKRGNHLEAIRWLERALAIQDTREAERDPWILGSTLLTLACARRDAGMPDLAEPLFRRVLGIHESTLGRDNALTRATATEYAAMLRSVGRPGDAAALEERFGLAAR